MKGVLCWGGGEGRAEVGWGIIDTGRGERGNEANDLNNYRHINFFFFFFFFALSFFQALDQSIVTAFIALSVTHPLLVGTM